MVRRSLENHDHSSTGNGGRAINPETVEVAESLGIPVESSDADADNGRLYFNSTDRSIKYKDSGGNVYSGAQGDVNNPMTADLDADGNNIENVGSLSTDEATTGNLTVQEDGNSPLIVSGSSSGTITLASQYDVVRCYIVDNSGAQALGLQVNGDTGANYDAVTINGTEKSAESEIGPLGFTNLATGLQMVMAGSWSGSFVVSNRPVDNQSERVVGGRNTNVASPLDSITLTASSAFSATMHVFGLNFS